jgi:hypothetical protein
MGSGFPVMAPELGIEVNETAAAKHPLKQEVLHSMLDW